MSQTQSEQSQSQVTDNGNAASEDRLDNLGTSLIAMYRTLSFLCEAVHERDFSKGAVDGLACVLKLLKDESHDLIWKLGLLQYDMGTKATGNS